ncbi:uncharacterized protein XB5852327.L [Xenopus laevis]|uniref:Uncharacterized protein n=2 Tax=Xenopus laevis TaxID=8355 RepID=A0AA97PYM1_XENLA|nr:uncharacterized protein XB5852327.L [Xenopus laevis]OCT56082.1 hypothetical protein XELAEV_18002627mg [Xenopus laevis]
MSLRSIADLLLTAALLHLPLALSMEVYTTSYGGTCIGTCGRENSDYYWCKQKGGDTGWWDYCSPEKGYDAYYRPCLSACQKVTGSKYEQCFTDNGWSKCGHVVEEFERYYTSSNILCASECMSNEDYYKCTDVNGDEEKCSLLNDLTAKGEPCRTDHPCDSHGNSYTWCYTDTSDNWDYCGKVISDCEPKRHKRANGDDVVCRVKDTGNKRELVLTAVEVPARDFRKPSVAQFTEASHLINTVNAKFSFPSTARTVANSKNIRMDMQGTFKRDGVRYMNVQLQLNEPRQGSSTRHSTTIAQILFPQDLDVAVFSRYIRRALQTSLRSAYHGPPVRIIINLNPL